MNSNTRDRIEDWEEHPFGGGRDGLEDVARTGFTGAVRAGTLWVFLLNGRVVGVSGGTLGDLEGMDGTAFEAPDAGPALIAAMLEGDGETRAKYYTEDTPISEVDRTLRDGGFTGYLELSENVLSGDYYVAYYGGERLPVAYIGTSERLLTGEEAFEKADNEVGIYEVVDVDLEVRNILEDGSGAEGTPGTSVGASTDASPSETVQEDEGTTSSETTAATGTASAEDGAATSLSSDSGVGPAESGTAGHAGEDGTREESGTAAARTGNAGASTRVGGDAETGGASDDETSGSDDGAATGVTDGERAGGGDGETGAHPSAAGATGGASDPPSDGSRGTADGAGSTPAGDGRSSAAADDVRPAGTGRSEPGSSTAASGREAGVEASYEERSTGASGRERSSGPDPTEQRALEERLREEEQWRETRSIPSIDPDRSESARDQPSRRQGRGDSAGGGSPAGRPARGGDSSRTRSGRQSESRTTQPEPADDGPLRSDMLEREDKIDQLQQRVENLEQERRQLTAERDELSTERDQLGETVEELESRIQQLEAELDERNRRIEDLETELERRERSGPTSADERAAGGGGTGPGADQSGATAATGQSGASGDSEHRAGGTAPGSGGSAAGSAAGADGPAISKQEAIDGTNLFVRYDSKSAPTLETAHAGDADAATVRENLRIEHHTPFEAATASVEGRPYREFLDELMEYQFVEWLITTLPFEIRDTGHASALSQLYDALPRIDRAELNADVEVEPDQGDPVTFTFDVVAFDRRGTPLVVANVNDSRRPATESMLEDIEEASSAITYDDGTLAAGFLVTASFFEPDALAAAEEATKGGFLGRDSSASYVKLGRKRGYHLCLVESREGEFHVTQPEL